jgi:hypothetical protein
MTNTSVDKFGKIDSMKSQNEGKERKKYQEKPL